jgi:hypothetical protein
MATSTPHRAAAEPSGRDFPAVTVTFEEGELAVGQPSLVLPELPHARPVPEGSVGRDPARAAEEVTWLELTRRFEPEG